MDMSLEMSMDMSILLRFSPSAEKLVFVAQAKFSVARAIFLSLGGDFFLFFPSAGHVFVSLSAFF